VGVQDSGFTVVGQKALNNSCNITTYLSCMADGLLCIRHPRIAVPCNPSTNKGRGKCHHHHAHTKRRPIALLKGST
jgi:hypothetical protein